MGIIDQVTFNSIDYAKGAGNILEFQNLNTTLKNKLEREFAQSNKDLLLEDIKEFLLLNEWRADTIHHLLNRERLLHDLLIKLVEDDEFNHLFERKIKALVQDLN